MKKKILSFILMLCMAATVIPFTAMESEAATAYQESEPNDYIGYADVVSVATGNTVNGYSNYVDPDWYKFTLSKSCEIKIKMYAFTDSGAGLLFNIYSSNDLENQRVSEFASYNYNLGYAYLSKTCYLPKGTYYMRAQINSGAANVKYKISFTSTKAFGNVPEPNDTIGTAFVVKNGVKYNSMLENKGYYAQMVYFENKDRDYYKYTASSAGYYYLTVYNYDINTKVSAMNSSGTGRSIFKNTWNGTYFSAGNGRTTKLVKLPKGSTYFCVYSEYDTGKYQISITRKPTKVTGVKTVKYGSKSIKVKWNKKSGVTGYKIYRSTKKNSGYKLIKTVKSSKTNSYIDKNKKKGTKYYYKVAAYKTVNGYACRGYYSNVVSRIR